jgi:hypothetical protein
MYIYYWPKRKYYAICNVVGKRSPRRKPTLSKRVACAVHILMCADLDEVAKHFEVSIWIPP